MYLNCVCVGGGMCDFHVTHDAGWGGSLCLGAGLRRLQHPWPRQQASGDLSDDSSRRVQLFVCPMCCLAHVLTHAYCARTLQGESYPIVIRLESLTPEGAAEGHTLDEVCRL